MPGEGIDRRSSARGRRSGQERIERGKREKDKGKRKIRKGEKGGKQKKRVEGPLRENRKREEGGCKKAGGGNRKRPGETRVWRLGFAWLGIWAYLAGLLSLASQNILFLFLKIDFGK